MKKLINAPENVVKDALAGMAIAHGDLLKVSYDPDFIVRADGPVSGKVGIVSGGGSGHEPMHGGFVGKGMLDAACPGAVFTSPVPDQMLAATKAVDGGAGVLHIVKNYTGDVMNFEMAAELAAAEGIEVASVVTNEVPGPTLRVRLGETVRVTFTNKLPQPTTIHWHGVRVPNAMDGVPGVTQALIAPGETFVYEFTLEDGILALDEISGDVPQTGLMETLPFTRVP